MELTGWRFFEGPNVHCYRPVFEGLLNLRPWTNRKSTSFSQLTPALLERLPGLSGHHCGLGYPGGFVTRLREGTLLGHIVEHVCLELLAACGEEVVYGKTRHAGGEHYQVVFEAASEEMALCAVHLAIRWVEGIVRGQVTHWENEFSAFRDRLAELAPGPSTKSIMEAAQARRIPVRRLGQDSALQLGWGHKAKRVIATMGPETSVVAADMAKDKALSKKLLAEAGLPVPGGGIAGSLEEARRIAAKIGFPLVTKPLSGNQGKGVTLGIAGDAELRSAFEIAQAFDERVLVEPQVGGRQYRALVVGGKVVALSERLPAHVVGDGVHSVAWLVERENEDPRRGREHERELTRIPMDAVALMTLRRQGLSRASVPPLGARVLLRESANLSTGGVAIDRTDQADEAFKAACVRAAAALGLDIAGVDIVSPGPDERLLSSGGILEVNACPGIRMHQKPWRGKARDAAGAIVDHVMKGSDGRIPVIAITGTNGKSSTVRLVAHLLQSRYEHVGFTSTEGVFLDGSCLSSGDCSGPQSARLLLSNPKVEACVLECARGGLRRGGLAHDDADVAALLNISSDHLGQDGIATLEDLAHVKSLVIERVREGGHGVLNADDPTVIGLSGRVPSAVTLFSSRRDSLVVRRHRTAGGRAVFVRDARIVFSEGAWEKPAVALSQLSFTFGGASEAMVANALAAAAIAWGAGLGPAEIASALASFEGGPSANPGRQNLYHVGGIRVVLDYGHNAAAVESMFRTLRAMSPRRILAVVGIPGDRRDEDARAVGRVAGQAADLVFVKEDRDLRGRRAGEVAGLIADGIRACGRGEMQCQLVLDEVHAFRTALDAAGEGDLVVAFYERLQPLQSVLDHYQGAHTGAVTLSASV